MYLLGASEVHGIDLDGLMIDIFRKYLCFFARNPGGLPKSRWDGQVLMELESLVHRPQYHNCFPVVEAFLQNR